MSGRLVPLILLCLLALPPCFPDLACADPAPATSGEQLVVLRNGEVLTGRVSREGDRYLVAAEGSELRLAQRDVDFVCQSLDEAYTVQRQRVVAGHIEDHLQLAEWCLRQKLHGYAAREIAVAMTIDPRDRRVMQLDRRLQQALAPSKPTEARVEATGASADHSAASPALPVSAEELERLVRSLPAGTVEKFTSNIQPVLLNHCATAGCHGPGATSNYVLNRPSSGRTPVRRLTQRNLYNSLQWLNFEKPDESKLLEAARAAHGPNRATGAAVLEPPKYQELVVWVTQTAHGLGATATPGSASPTQSQLTPGTAGSAVLASQHAGPTSPRVGRAAQRQATLRPLSAQPAAKPSTIPRASAPGGASVQPVAPGAKSTDPFDPDEFNRRFAPPADESPAPVEPADQK